MNCLQRFLIVSCLVISVNADAMDRNGDSEHNNAHKMCDNRQAVSAAVEFMFKLVENHLDIREKHDASSIKSRYRTLLESAADKKAEKFSLNSDCGECISEQQLIALMVRDGYESLVGRALSQELLGALYVAATESKDFEVSKNVHGLVELINECAEIEKAEYQVQRTFLSHWSLLERVQAKIEYHKFHSVENERSANSCAKPIIW